MGLPNASAISRNYASNMCILIKGIGSLLIYAWMNITKTLETTSSLRMIVVRGWTCSAAMRIRNLDLYPIHILFSISTWQGLCKGRAVHQIKVGLGSASEIGRTNKIAWCHVSCRFLIYGKVHCVLLNTVSNNSKSCTIYIDNQLRCIRDGTWKVRLTWSLHHALSPWLTFVPWKF